MMGIARMVAGGLVAVGVFVWPAAGQELITAAQPERVEAILKGFGIARLGAHKSNGDPQISGRADGKTYEVFFYGCTANANCASIQFWSYWSKQVALEEINAWNAKSRYGKVYNDADGDLVLEYDVNLGVGVDERTLEGDADLWIRLLASVEDDLID